MQSRYVAAYNAQDLGALESLLADDVVMTHHNRGVEVHGCGEFMAIIRGMTRWVPDRAYREIVSVAVNGSKVYYESVWSGTATRPVSGFWDHAGPVTFDFNTVLTVDGGKITCYSDYG